MKKPLLLHLLSFLLLSLTCTAAGDLVFHLPTDNRSLYEEGGDATFTIWADYADKLTWMVEDRGSGSTSFYNLEEFAEALGFTYTAPMPFCFTYSL